MSNWSENCGKSKRVEKNELELKSGELPQTFSPKTSKIEIFQIPSRNMSFCSESYAEFKFPPQIDSRRHSETKVGLKVLWRQTLFHFLEEKRRESLVVLVARNNSIKTNAQPHLLLLLLLDKKISCVSFRWMWWWWREEAESWSGGRRNSIWFRDEFLPNFCRESCKMQKFTRTRSHKVTSSSWHYTPSNGFGN